MHITDWTYGLSNTLACVGNKFMLNDINDNNKKPLHVESCLYWIFSVYFMTSLIEIFFLTLDAIFQTFDQPNAAAHVSSDLSHHSKRISTKQSTYFTPFIEFYFFYQYSFGDFL